MNILEKIKKSPEQQSGEDSEYACLSETERASFLTEARRLPDRQALFCEVLYYTGCHVTQALKLTLDHVWVDRQQLLMRPLKRKHAFKLRSRKDVQRFVQVPVSPQLIARIVEVFGLPDQAALHERKSPLFDLDRPAAYRLIANVMQRAAIHGPQASPRGLRYSVNLHKRQQRREMEMRRKRVNDALANGDWDSVSSLLKAVNRPSFS